MDKKVTLGLIYTNIALHYKHDTMQRIFAENAYYFLAESYFEHHNRSILPTLFILLESGAMAIPEESKHIQYFLLNEFYDQDRDQFCVPVDLLSHLPSMEEIDAFFTLVHSDRSFNKQAALKRGKEQFQSLYCELGGMA